jgi:hypothetical protein
MGNITEIMADRSNFQTRSINGVGAPYYLAFRPISSTDQVSPLKNLATCFRAQWNKCVVHVSCPMYEQNTVGRNQ